jgi:hypothetical protein
VGADNAIDNKTAAGAVATDLLELIRAQAVVDRLSGFRRVPPNVNGVAQTQRATAYWMGECQALPASALSFFAAGLINELRIGAPAAGRFAGPVR